MKRKPPVTIQVDDYLVDVLKSAVRGDLDFAGQFERRECEFRDLEKLLERTLSVVRIVNAYEHRPKRKAKP